MSTMRDHLSSFHKAAAQHHAAMGEFHKNLSEHHAALQAVHAEDLPEAAECHGDIAGVHKDATKQHASAASFHLEACKALGMSDGDAAQKTAAGTTIAVEQVELQQLREALHKVSALLGNRIMPDTISGVVTSNPNVGITPIIRPGQQELVKRDGVPVEFENLIKVEA